MRGLFMSDRPTPAGGERRGYGACDGMRGVAAVAVVTVHTPLLLAPFTAVSAGLAVDLFFLMSGFILAHAYEAKLWKKLSVGRFIVLRMIRLYPLYLVGLLFGVAEAAGEIAFGHAQDWTPSHLLEAGLAGLGMIPCPPATDDNLVVPIFPLNPPAWSLFFEILVNIAYAVTLPLLSNRVLGAIVALAGVGLLVFGLQHGDLHFGSHWSNVAGGSGRVIFSFGAGVLIYRLAPQGIGLRVPPLLILLACAAIFAVAPGALTGPYEMACVLVLMPLLVLLGVSVEPGPLLKPSFAFLGVTSYGVYSLHYPLALAVQGAIRIATRGEEAQWAPWSGLVFLGALLLGVSLVDRFYDSPVRRYLTRLGRQPPAAGAERADPEPRPRLTPDTGGS